MKPDSFLEKFLTYIKNYCAFVSCTSIIRNVYQIAHKRIRTRLSQLWLTLDYLPHSERLVIVLVGYKYKQARTRVPAVHVANHVRSNIIWAMNSLEVCTEKKVSLSISLPLFDNVIFCLSSFFFFFTSGIHEKVVWTIAQNRGWIV